MKVRNMKVGNEILNKSFFKKILKSKGAYFLLLPGMGLFLTFILFPLIYSLRMSFYKWNIVNPGSSEFVGFSNYVKVINDPIFIRAAFNTIVYALMTVPGQILFALMVAILLEQKIRGRTFFRVAFYITVITSWVIVTLVFEYLFSGQAGLVNFVLKDVLHLVNEKIMWLANPILVMIPLNLLGIWKGVGWSAIIFLAALQNIPPELYEAAIIDGAGIWQKITKITLPLIRPTLVFLVVVLTIGAFNVYISGLLMTDGGNPLDLSHFILTLMYKKTFTYLDFGYGSATSYLLAAFIFMISVIQIKLLRRRVEY
ncbi:MAG: sugar ABC transporter permease [Actinobacteria bacterium]|nr:sugar ABC transporter permease [Actinomycetota bacterium]